MRVSKTYDLRIALQTELKNLCANCYFEENSDKPFKYPYLVYEIEDIGSNYQLEINVFDYSKSSKAVEDLTDLIESHFKNFIYRDANQVFRTFKNTRNTIKEDDKSIRRRRLLIDLYYNGRE